MGKKFGAKTKTLNKVKQTPSKMGAKKQKFGKAKQSPISPKMRKNVSFDSKKGKNNKVSFGNDSLTMKTPLQRKSSGSFNSLQKGSTNSKKSLISNRKATPFPHTGKTKLKKVESEEEEEEEMEEVESDVSFESGDDFSDDSLSDSKMIIESAEEETEEEEVQAVVKKASKVSSKKELPPSKSKSEVNGKAGNDSKGSTLKGVESQKVKKKPETVVKKPDVPVDKPEVVQKKAKQGLGAEKSVKRKREDTVGKGVKMTAEEYTNANDSKRVFVTNLPDNVTDEEIRTLHPDCKDFVLLAAYRKRKGSAILVFADEATAERAKASLKGKKLRTKDLVVDYVGAKNSRKNPQELGPIVDTRLYVGNLAEHCTEENLKIIFSNATLISVPSQRRHTFGFVEFADAASAMDAVIKHNYSVYKGEKMIVQFARAKVGEKPKDKKKKAQKVVESDPKRAKVVEEEDSDEDDTVEDGEDIGDVDTEDDGDDSEIEDDLDDDDDDSDDGQQAEDSDGGDDLESFDDEDD